MKLSIPTVEVEPIAITKAYYIENSIIKEEKLQIHVYKSDGAI